MGVTEDGILIDKYLRSKGSPLAGHGGTFAIAGADTGIDPWFIVAISGAETGFGKTGGAAAINNPFGLGGAGHLIHYKSWDDAIGAAFRTVKGYNTTSIAGVQRRWAPLKAANDPTGLNVNWIKTVSQLYRETGHNPSKPITTDAQGSSIDTDITNAPKDAAKDAVNAATGGNADAIAAAAGAVAGLAGNLTSKAWWLRVGFVVGGSACLLIAARVLLHESIGGRSKTSRRAAATVASSAGAAATVAA